MESFGCYQTRRRRIKARVSERMRFWRDSNQNSVSQNLDSSETDSQIVGNPNESQAVYSESGQESDSEIVVNHNDELASQAVYSESGQESDSEIVYYDFGEEIDCQAESDSVAEESDPCTQGSIRSNLADWAAGSNISHSELSKLLHVLVQGGLDVPKDPRTLLSTMRTCEVKEIAGGSYYHFGVSNAIISVLSHESHPLVDTLTLRVNIDGTPPFKSARMDVWPILAKIKEFPGSNVIVLGLYAGRTKPNNAGEYLKDLIQDLKVVTREGFDYNGKHYSVALPDAFICDAPARAFLKCIKGHTGYGACERCVEHGIYLDGKVVFPDLTAPLRTDSTFERMMDDEHHHGASPLQELGIGMVSSFALDYMHLVCLGVVKRLIGLWMKGPLTCRLSSNTITSISNHLQSIRECIPSNFSRKPRSLLEFRMWKATEFRQFLLYTGPVVLKGRLPTRLYKNFMVLSIAMRILLSPALCSAYCDYADKLLKCYVTNFSKIYGPEQVVYNTHSLIHLADDARKFGALDNVSCFPFENYLGTLKRLVRRPQGIVPQLVRRLGERNRLDNGQERGDKPQQPHVAGPTLPDRPARMQYKQYRHEGNIISISQGNNCFNVEGRVAVVKNIVQLFSGAMYAVCQFYDREGCFCSYPLDSSCVGIKTVTQLSGRLHGVPVTDLTEKLILLPFQDGSVAFPQLHNQ